MRAALALAALAARASATGTGQTSWSTVAASGQHTTAGAAPNTNFAVTLLAADGVTPAAGWTAGTAHVVALKAKTGGTYATAGFTGFIFAPFSGTVRAQSGRSARARKHGP